MATALNTTLLPAISFVAAVGGVIEAVALAESSSSRALGVLFALADVVAVDAVGKVIEDWVVFTAEAANLAGVITAGGGRDEASSSDDGNGLEDGRELHFDGG